MQNTIFQSFSLPTLPNDPSCIANGTDVPVRVLIRNDGGVIVFLAPNSEVLTGASAPGSQMWPLDPNDEEVFILAPRQSLYAIAAGVGGRIKMSVSEALPLV